MEFGGLHQRPAAQNSRKSAPRFPLPNRTFRISLGSRLAFTEQAKNQASRLRIPDATTPRRQKSKEPAAPKPPQKFSPRPGSQSLERFLQPSRTALLPKSSDRKNRLALPEPEAPFRSGKLKPASQTRRAFLDKSSKGALGKASCWRKPQALPFSTGNATSNCFQPQE